MGFGKAEVIYVALRWNDSQAGKRGEEKMRQDVAKKLHCSSRELKIYNLCHPSKDRGMTLLPDEFLEVERTLRRIK